MTFTHPQISNTVASRRETAAFRSRGGVKLPTGGDGRDA